MTSIAGQADATAGNRAADTVLCPPFKLGELLGADLDVGAGPGAAAGVLAADCAAAGPVGASVAARQFTLDVQHVAVGMQGHPRQIAGIVVTELPNAGAHRGVAAIATKRRERLGTMDGIMTTRSSGCGPRAEVLWRRPAGPNECRDIEPALSRRSNLAAPGDDDSWFLLPEGGRHGVCIAAGLRRPASIAGHPVEFSRGPRAAQQRPSLPA